MSDDSEHVLAGRWLVHEDTLRKHIWATLKCLSDASKSLIKFDPDEFGDEVHILSTDTVNFTIDEPRTDPSSKWFDPKSHSAGMSMILYTANDYKNSYHLCVHA